MATFSLTLKSEQSERAIRRLGDRAPLAIARALNRAAGAAKTVMVRAVAADMGLKAGTVREQIKVQEARPVRDAEMVARLSVSGTRIPLIEFGARGPEPSRGRGKGVTSRLKGGEGRYPHAFLATMRSGHRGVFIRRPATSKRHGPKPQRPQLPIYELRGPSLPHVFQKYFPLGLARGEEALATTLEHELTFRAGQSA